MNQGSPVFSNLAFLFNPGTVAVIGASDNPGKLGFHVMKSLTTGGFKGVILPVNPGCDSVRGLRTVPSIRAYDGPVELAVVFDDTNQTTMTMRSTSGGTPASICFGVASFGERTCSRMESSESPANAFRPVTIS